MVGKIRKRGLKIRHTKNVVALNFKIIWISIKKNVFGGISCHWCYLGSVLEDDEDFYLAIKRRSNSKWINW